MYDFLWLDVSSSCLLTMISGADSRRPLPLAHRFQGCLAAAARSAFRELGGSEEAERCQVSVLMFRFRIIRVHVVHQVVEGDLNPSCLEGSPSRGRGGDGSDEEGVVEGHLN